MSESAIYLRTPTASSEGGADGNAPGVPTLQSLGVILRDRRESAGIPLAEVEDATRIRQKYLAAIEADEWHLLPGEVVGRGFLRNYAYYLNLDPNQMIDRRRAMVDSSLSRTLADTSTGVRLPPVRPVDYRPQDVDLEHTSFSTRITEFFESMRDWMVPILAAVLIVLIVLIVLWGARQLGGQFGVILSTFQERLSTVTEKTRSNKPGKTTAPMGPAARTTMNRVSLRLRPRSLLCRPQPPPRRPPSPRPPPTRRRCRRRWRRRRRSPRPPRQRRHRPPRRKSRRWKRPRRR